MQTRHFRRFTHTKKQQNKKRKKIATFRSVTEPNLTDASARGRRRRLTGSGAHRLSSPGKLQLDVTISPRSQAEQHSSGIDEGMPTERSVKSLRAAHQVTLPPSRSLFLSVIYRRGRGCPLVSSSRRESQPFLPLTTNEASPSATDSWIHFKEAEAAEGKTPVT